MQCSFEKAMTKHAITIYRGSMYFVRTVSIAYQVFGLVVGYRVGVPDHHHASFLLHSDQSPHGSLGAFVPSLVAVHDGHECHWMHVHGHPKHVIHSCRFTATSKPSLYPPQSPVSRLLARAPLSTRVSKFHTWLEKF